MTSPYVDLLYHFVPLLAISLAVLINLTVTHWRTEARAATDASRLRAALRAELTILQDVYDENSARSTPAGSSCCPVGS